MRTWKFLLSCGLIEKKHWKFLLSCGLIGGSITMSAGIHSLLAETPPPLPCVYGATPCITSSYSCYVNNYITPYEAASTGNNKWGAPCGYFIINGQEYACGPYSAEACY